MRYTFLLLLTGSFTIVAQSSNVRRFYAPASGDSLRTMEYEVKQGETLFHIAERFAGNPYRAESLARDNGISDPLRLKAGTRIRVPAPQAAIRYSIERLTPDGDLIAHQPSEGMTRGDRFFLRLETNAAGYLYLFNRSGDHSVTRIVPSGKRALRIQAFSEYWLPAKSAFQLDNMRSDEELWIVLSSAPLSELDAALDSGVLEAAEIRTYSTLNSTKGVILTDDPEEDEPDLLVEGRGDGRLLIVHQVTIRRR